jgi:hypothetical protein
VRRACLDDCLFCAQSDHASREAYTHWQDYYGVMNTVTHRANVPCDVLALTRQRVQHDVLLSELREHHAKLGALLASADDVDGLVHALGHSPQPRVVDGASVVPVTPVAGAAPVAASSPAAPPFAANMVNCGGADNVLSNQGPIYTTIALLGEGPGWRELVRRSRTSELSDTLDEIAGALAGSRKLLNATSSILATRRQLHRIEAQLARHMYPKTLHDMMAMLRAHDVIPQAGYKPLTVPALAAEKCCLCLSDDIDALFVRITPRCMQHEGCIDVRRSGGACSCTGSHLVHLECLARDMLSQYRGDSNEGVGRSQLRCASCRGAYCIGDLQCVRVERTAAKRPADSPLPEPTPKKTKVYGTRPGSATATTN